MKPRGGPLIVLSSLLFGGMALCAKAASVEVSPNEISFVRAAFGLTACLLVATRRPFRFVNHRGLVIRAVTGASAVYLYFLAIAHLPVGIATLLNYTAPLFTALWCALLFREPIERRTAAALALTTFGLALVLYGKLPGVAVGWWELVGLCGAVCSGLAMAYITEVRRTDGAWEIFAAFSIGCFLVTAPQALSSWRTPSPRVWLLLTAMGVFSVVAQLLITHAMGFLSATLAGVINQLTPVTSLVLGTWIFHERFGAVVTAGIVLTLVGSLLGALLGSSAAATGSAAARHR